MRAQLLKTTAFWSFTHKTGDQCNSVMQSVLCVRDQRESTLGQVLFLSFPSRCLCPMDTMDIENGALQGKDLPIRCGPPIPANQKCPIGPSDNNEEHFNLRRTNKVSFLLFSHLLPSLRFVGSSFNSFISSSPFFLPSSLTHQTLPPSPYISSISPPPK